MLLVVVDEAGIRRRGEDAVEGPFQRELARVAVQDRRLAFVVADTRELLDPRERVTDVPAEEAGGGFDRPARTPVLVAPVLGPLRRFRRLEVEVCCPPSRPRSAREDHAQDLHVPVPRDQLAKGE